MVKIQYTLLLKFLNLFISTTDLNEQQDKDLFTALKIIQEHPPVQD